MAQDPDDARLKALGERIAEAKRASAPGRPVQEEHYSQAQVAWRMVTELVAGLGIGFGIGYGLDRLIGTTPFLMVLFIGLGFAAGVQTMMRTAREVERKRREPQREERPETGQQGRPRAADGGAPRERDGTGAPTERGNGQTAPSERGER